MNVARLRALVARVEAAVEFDDLGATWTRLGRDNSGGGLVFSIWWVRGCRRLTVRFYLGSTTIEVSVPGRRRRRTGVELLIAGERDFLMVLRRGVEWLRSEALPREFDPGSKAAEIVPDFDEEP